MNVIVIDRNNVVEEVRPGLLHVQQRNTLTGTISSIFLTKAVLKWLAEVIDGV